MKDLVKNAHEAHASLVGKVYTKDIKEGRRNEDGDYVREVVGETPINVEGVGPKVKKDGKNYAPVPVRVLAWLKREIKAIGA